MVCCDLMAQLYNMSSSKEKRRELGNNPTIEEEMLWNRLRRNAIGFHFRRQFSIGHYIVDFYCPHKKLAVELDGSQHLEDREYDTIREQFMGSLGIRTVRFSNLQVRRDANKVVGVIFQILKEI